MRIMNNMSSVAALGEMKKNDKAFGKVMKRLASGMKLNSAGDGAAEYSISENMRVRIRCLGQDSENVRNGKSLLQVAEGAVQSQINLMRTIKERVINANNDTNTDIDRQIIQKEINQYYNEINDIAYTTEFNGKHLLMGTTVTHTFESWVVLDEAVPVEGSDTLGIIKNAVHASLDGQQGPFATFGASKADDPRETVDYDGYKTNRGNISSLVGNITNTDPRGTDYFHGGTAHTPNEIKIDLSSGYGTFSSSNKTCLDNVSFSVRSPWGTSRYVLTTDTTRRYDDYGINKIDISGCSSTADVANAIKAAIGSTGYEATVEGSVVKLKAKIPSGWDGDSTNRTSNYNVAPIDVPGRTDTVTVGGTPGTPPTPAVPERTGASASGLGNKFLSGGANSSGHYAVTGGHWEYMVPGDEDSKVWKEDKSWVEDSPAKKATLTVTGVSSVASGTGITIKGSGSNTYVKFVDGDAGPSRTYSDSGAGSTQYYTIGKNYTGTWNRNGMTIKFADGNMTMTADSTGTYANGYGISDGFATVPAKPEIPGTPGTPGTPTTVVYTGTTPLGASNIVNDKIGKNGETAHWDLDFSAYNVSDEEKANELIKSYVGKTLQHSAYLTNFEFIDSGSSNTMDKETKQSSSTPIDLATVRTAVKAGATASEAFSTLLNSRMSSYSKLIKNGAGEVTGLQIDASVSGTAGNNQRMTTADGELRHYTIDFKSWTDGKTNIPAELNEKGFRFYCATDAEQWVNVMFVNGFDGMDKDKPASGTATQDIKTVLIDISGVTDAKSLVEVIDKDLGDYLKNVYKHNFLLASDTEAGTVTIYDKRKYTVLDKGYLGTREKGAKIADGVMDNVVKDSRYLYANRIIIHHTDKSSNNIKIDIPQTSMDQIFGYKKENYEPEYFNVLTKEMRERLLGWDPPGEKGIIDKGIDYLLDAQTLIGSQIKRMEFTDENITAAAESTTAAESVIRDSDMAKEYCEFSKASILMQTAQAMLGQSNQNAGRAVELLQGA